MSETIRKIQTPTSKRAPKNPSIYNIIRWFAEPMGQASDVQSIFFFMKMKIKSFECPKSIRNYETKILGSSYDWLTIRFSHWPGKPAYYIVD